MCIYFEFMMHGCNFEDNLWELALSFSMWVPQGQAWQQAGLFSEPSWQFICIFFSCVSSGNQTFVFSGQILYGLSYLLCLILHLKELCLSYAFQSSRILSPRWGYPRALWILAFGPTHPPFTAYHIHLSICPSVHPSVHPSCLLLNVCWFIEASIEASVEHLF